jgi:hypothetical protein
MCMYICTVKANVELKMRLQNFILRFFCLVRLRNFYILSSLFIEKVHSELFLACRKSSEPLATRSAPTQQKISRNSLVLRSKQNKGLHTYIHSYILYIILKTLTCMWDYLNTSTVNISTDDTSTDDISTLAKRR